MKIPIKLPKSRPSSASSSPASSPRLHDHASSSISCRPHSPCGHKSDKGRSMQLCLPALSRSPRPRNSHKQEFSGNVSSTPASPLGKPPHDCKTSSPRSARDFKLGNMGVEVASMATSSGRGISQSFLDEIKHAFKKFDVDGDGKISAEELRCILRSLGDSMTQEEAELMIAEVDADEDGFIDLQEFIEMNTHVTINGAGSSDVSGALSDELAAAFAMFDLDKNGCITPDELHHVLVNLGNHSSSLDDCKRMINGVDRKGLGHVDLDDFKFMMSTTSMAA